jgi:hypothetical protein
VVSKEERIVGDGRACGHGFSIQLRVVSFQWPGKRRRHVVVRGMEVQSRKLRVKRKKSEDKDDV